jgi:hypothetical protein
LAGSTVTIHEHLDGAVSIRYGPHVVGRHSPTGEKLDSATPKEQRWQISAQLFSFCITRAKPVPPKTTVAPAISKPPWIWPIAWSQK